jgi:hypothetical protein
MKNLQSLCNLLKRLSIVEVKFLLKLLGNEHEKSLKSIELTKIIYFENETNSIIIQKKIYDKINNIAFRKLVERLKNKVLDSLLIQPFETVKGTEARSMVIFDLRKKLIQSDLLSLKGLREDADSLCKRVISKAQEYELYDIISQSLLIRQRFVTTRKKVAEVKSISENVELYEKMHKSTVKCQLIYNSTLNKITNARNKLDYLDDLNKSISTIGEEYELYKSNIVGYYLHILLTEQYQLNNNFLKAMEHLNVLSKLVNLKSIYTNNRMGAIILNISNNNIHMGNYDLSLKYAALAGPYFSRNIFNTSLVEEHKFYSYFYKSDYKTALEIILKLIDLPRGNELNHNKWFYYLSFIKFVFGDYNECIKILNSIDELRFGTEDWNINKRLLIIMCRIELQNYESVDLNVASLERYIKRMNKRNDIKPRYIYIIRVLLKLINCNYNYLMVSNQRKKYLLQLQGEHVNYMWSHKTAELIPFSSWFNEKLSNYRQSN